MKSGEPEIKRVIITGVSGLVGNHLVRRISNTIDLIGVSREPRNIPSHNNITSVSLDISDSRALMGFLSKTDFNLIINCAAMTDVDRCEIDRGMAHQINAEAPSIMADICSTKNRLFMQISTDYIFDGKNGPYPEDATPNPINYYGQTKLEAEEAIQSAGCQHIIVRTNHLYGNLPEGPSRLVRWVLEAKEHPVKAANDQFNNSIWAGSLADSIIKLTERDFRGVINIGGPDYLSRYEFAIRCAEAFGIDKNRIIKVPIAELGMKAPRPPKAGLTIGKMKMILGAVPVGVSDGMIKVRDGII